VRKVIEVLVAFGWSLHTRDGYRCTEGVQQHTFLGPIFTTCTPVRVLSCVIPTRWYRIVYVVNKLTNTINQNRSGSLLKMYTCVYTRVPQLYYPGTSLHTYRTLIGTVSCERSHVSQIFRLGPTQGPFPGFRNF
jgi:hypothetical protein